MTTLDLFDYGTEDGFEGRGHENGMKFWYARDFMALLGYQNFQSFEKAIQKAMTACNALRVPLDETIIPLSREIDGKSVKDYKLNRFGCYLTAMNCDVRKPQVAQAQGYFAQLSTALVQYVQHADAVERVVYREEITDHEKTLSASAQLAGVVNYAFFRNAGYRGMYNMNLTDLRQMKGVPDKRSPLDFMGKTELAANLFRITQTEEKISRQGIKGQHELERTAESVGREVRDTMHRISGAYPEDLPTAADIQDVKKKLKKGSKDFKKLDKPSKEDE